MAIGSTLPNGTSKCDDEDCCDRGLHRGHDTAHRRTEWFVSSGVQHDSIADLRQSADDKSNHMHGEKVVLSSVPFFLPREAP